MNIKIENNQNFYRENFKYNKDISILIKGIFETNSIGRIAYIVSNPEDFKNSGRPYFFSKMSNRREFLKPQEEDIHMKYSSYTGLGPLEFSLASYLLDPYIEYEVFVLTGALGSGKSTLSNYILDYIVKNNQPLGNPLYFPKNGIVHRINFNEHFDSEDKDKIVEEFRLLLIDKLSSFIEDLHREHLFINTFIQKIQSGSDERFLSFRKFLRKLTKEDSVTEEQKFSSLLNWIDEQTHVGYKLRLLAYLLGFIKDHVIAPESKGGKQVDFILLLDNIDRLNDDAQIEILNTIFSFSIKLRIKILIPMRLTTFGKIRGNGSYNFGVLENSGPSPLSIVSARITHFLENPSVYNLTGMITQDFREPLIAKFKFIQSQFDPDSSNTRLNFSFAAIAGKSVRRGLFVAERFFMNAAFSYKTSENHADDFIRALLVSNSEGAKMIGNDKLVNNLFSTNTGSNTLLKVRILQILNYHREFERNCLIAVVLSQIALLEEYSHLDVVEAINDLIYNNRRLAYVEGVVTYGDPKNLTQSMNDVIQITFSGLEYLNTLLYSVEYLQNCFASVSWAVQNTFKNIDYIENHLEKVALQDTSVSTTYLRNVLDNRNVVITDLLDPLYDFKEVAERMKFLRNCLYFLLIADLIQLSVYYENNNIQSADNVEDRYIKNSIVLDIVGRTSISVLNILRLQYREPDETLNWKSFLLSCQIWSNVVFGSDNKNVAAALRQYSL